MLKELENEIESLENIQEKCKEIIQNAPEGKLRCAINKGCCQYYLGKTYLGKDKKTYIKSLAQKEYCEKLERETEKYLQKLRALKEIYSGEVLEEQFRGLHPGRKKMVEPLIKPVEDIIMEFEKIEYSGKIFWRKTKQLIIREKVKGCGRSQKRLLQMNCAGIRYLINMSCHCSC